MRWLAAVAIRSDEFTRFSGFAFGNAVTKARPHAYIVLYRHRFVAWWGHHLLNWGGLAPRVFFWVEYNVVNLFFCVTLYFHWEEASEILLYVPGQYILKKCMMLGLRLMVGNSWNKNVALAYRKRVFQHVRCFYLSFERSARVFLRFKDCNLKTRTCSTSFRDTCKPPSNDNIKLHESRTGLSIGGWATGPD